MKSNKRLWLLVVVAIVCAVAASPLLSSRAQDNTITLTLVVPTFNRDAFTDQLIGQFETAHPGVKVDVVKNDTGIPADTGGLDAHFAAVQTYTSAGDVLYIDPQRTALSEADTRAGYFLDLAPLVTQDTALNVDDFFPSIWQSYQWDKGIWVLPTAADIIVMSYDPTAFDNAKLAYPSDKWTMDDLINAATKLQQKDADGNLIPPIVLSPSSNMVILLRSLLGEGMFDNTAVPNPPQIDKPALEAMLDAWSQQVDQPGLVSGSGGAADTAPIAIASASNSLFPRRNNNNQTPRVSLMLPGGKAGIRAQGFAVSGGTQYPEQAYALASYLTTRGDIANRGAISPARKSLVGTQNNTGPGFRRNITPEVQAVIDQAVANGIPASELRYGSYVTLALANMKANKLSAKDALQAAEAQAVADQEAADAKKQTLALTVATPVPVPTLGAGKVAIKFAVSANVSPMPNQEKWAKLAQDFAASDPQVGYVNLDSRPGFGGNISTFTDNYDCFYLPFNAVPNTNLGLLLNMDPFMAADTTFDKGDMVGNVLAQVTRDNKIWALPIIVEPGILQYNSTQFEKAKLPSPGANWTIDAFRDAVQTLKPNPTDPAPFSASNANGTHLLILIAAYGGLPLDYRTTPPTINFTDQATVDAIRQVLDLAKGGYIKYEALGAIDFGGARLDRTVPIYTDTLNAFNFRPPAPTTTSTNDVYKPTNYPIGKVYSAVTYTIGTAYISAKSQNPDACYRWLTAVSHHPELFSAMPARGSLIDDPAIAGAQGPDLTALYDEINTLLKSPNTISIPALFGGGANPTGFLLPHWLYAAFDSYVLNNGDLESALKEADGFAKAFVQCVADIPPFDPATQNQRDYNAQYGACATKVDPSLKSIFGGN